MLKHLILVLTLLVALCGSQCPAVSPSVAKPRILFITATGPHSGTGKPYEHAVVKRNGSELSLAERQLVNTAAGEFDVEPTKDPTTMTPANLARYAAVASYTCGDPLDDQQRRALIDYVRNGGAFIGIHSAGDSFNTFADYAEMLGGIHDTHPGDPNVRILVVDKTSPATSFLPDSFETPHEPYAFTRWNPSSLHVLLKMDPASFAEKGKPNHSDYAVAWTKSFGRGRVFYTALGHNPSEWNDPKFLQHVLGGIRWAVGTGSGPGAITESRVHTPAATPPSQPPTLAAPASSASQGKLDELREHAMALTESVLGSLDQDTGASFRGYISDLREDLLDEAARKPAAGANAYNLAVQLCNTIIAVEREREVMIARLDNNKPSNAAGSAGVTKVHPNWRDLERERDEAARATHNNTLETSFHRQITVQWGLRAAQLRKTFDAEIAQFRTGLRQSPAPR